MLWIVWTLFLILTLGIIFYIKPRLFSGTLYFLGALMLALIISDPPLTTFLIILGIFLLIALPLNLLHIRQKYISSLFVNMMKKRIPAMSSTEKAAIDAGDPWWEAQLFSGSPRWDKLFSYKAPQLSEEEEAFINGPVAELCAMVEDEVVHKNLDLPPKAWDFIKEHKFWGIIIPKKFSGLEFSAFAHAKIISKLAGKSLTLATTVSVPNSLGPAELLLKYGTKQQQEYYLPRLAQGIEIPCFALTNTNAGSDASSISDYGIICYQKFNNTKTLGILIKSLDKRYITLGPIATSIGLAFKVYDPDNLLAEGIVDYGITCALLPHDTENLQVGRRHIPLSCPFYNGPITGSDIFMPLEWVIGGRKMIGHGWRMLMECLSAGRAISLPATAAGGALVSAFATGAYAHIRKQFNTSLSNFEGIQEPLARIGAFTYIINATRLGTTIAIDAGIKPAIASAIVKYHTTELGRKVANDTVDIHGGKAICLGKKNYIARSYQAIPISITVEGANILTRSLIIFGQGAMRCHPYLTKEMNALATNNISALDSLLFSHAGHLLQNLCKSIVLSLCNGRISSAPVKDATRKYFRYINRLSSNLAIVSDIALIYYGGALKRKEFISARLGDVLSYLYLSSMVLKYYQDQGAHPEDLPLVEYSCQYCLYKAERALHEMLHNMRPRYLARILLAICFPLGRKHHCPHDSLSRKIAALLSSNSDTRKRLTQHVFVGEGTQYPLNLLQQLLEQAPAFDEIEKTLLKAQKHNKITGYSQQQLLDSAVKEKIITRQQATIFSQYLKQRREVYAVDSFAQEELAEVSV